LNLRNKTGPGHLYGSAERIKVLDEEKAAIESRFCAADHLTRDPEAFQKDQQRLAELEDELSSTYARWEALEMMQADV